GEAIGDELPDAGMGLVADSYRCFRVLGVHLAAAGSGARPGGSRPTLDRLGRGEIRQRDEPVRVRGCPILLILHVITLRTPAWPPETALRIGASPPWAVIANHASRPSDALP